MSLILSVFPSFVMGGAQVRFCAVANHHGRAVRHAIIAMDGKLGCRERLDPMLDVTYPSFVVKPGSPIALLRRMRRLLRELRPDVLLTHNWGSIEWAFANAPIRRGLARHVHVEDGFGPEERDRQIGRRVWTRRVALRRAVIALPSRALMRLASDVWQLDPSRLHYVPNGVDLSRFAPGPGDPPRILQGSGPVVGTVAALRPEKNIARLLQAVAMVPELRLVVVGDGPERGGLTELASSLGIADRVAFAGHMDDPAPAYRHMDIFALSSDTEQMPLSVLEAMAAGLPVASTDVGDVAFMVAEKNSPFIVPREAASLATALRQLAGDAGLRRNAGAANRAKAMLEFSQDGMFARWGGLLQPVVEIRK